MRPGCFAVDGVPGCVEYRCAGRHGADGVRRAEDGLEAEHSDRREDDGMHSRHRAGSRDPEVEDLLRGNYVVYSSDGDYAGTPLLIEDRDRLQETSGTGIGNANITARRLDISGCENGLDMNQNFTVEDSYIHDLYNSASAHTDGIQFASGHLDSGRLASGSSTSRSGTTRSTEWAPTDLRDQCDHRATSASKRTC